MQKLIDDIASMLTAEKKAAEDKVLSGCSDYPSYQRSLGRIDAYKTALNKLEEIVNKLVKDNEEF